MRPARLPRRLLTLTTSLLVLAACGDEPSGPSDAELTARRLDQLADSLLDAGGLGSSVALRMASDALRSGAPLRSVTVSLDGMVGTWTGIAVRMSTSATACAQLLEDLAPVPPGLDVCAPIQWMTAWEGTMPEATRMIGIVGDTGTVDFSMRGGFESTEEVGTGFGFATFHELATDRLWWADSGSARAVEAATDGACPRQPARGEMAATFGCALARFQVSVGGRFRYLDVDVLNPLVPAGALPLEQGEPALPPRRVVVAPQLLGGMHLEIRRFQEFPSGPRLRVQAGRTGGSRESAAIVAALRYLGR